MTVAAHIARELGISASYAQRTLRRVKADLDRQPDTPVTRRSARATTFERPEQATSDQERDQAEVVVRSHDHLSQPDRERGDQATSQAEATRDGDGRTTTPNGDRHLALVVPRRDGDRPEVER
jgi:hypothetical protein